MKQERTILREGFYNWLLNFKEITATAILMAEDH